MSVIKEQVQVLSARLPELAWKLSSLYPVLPSKLLPPGLFFEQLELTPQRCIDEINHDLQTIKQHKNERVAHYLAKQVHRKINVLVQLCQNNRVSPSTKTPSVFGIHAISTRQQWLEILKEDVAKLNAQQQALATTFSKLESREDVQTLMLLKADIGEVERRLTLAKEALNRAMNI